MGRSTTPTYRVEVVANVPMSWFGWDCRINGLPTAANAEKFRTGYNATFQPNSGHPNATTGDRVVPHISKVQVIRQRTGAVVAEAVGPMFEVV